MIGTINSVHDYDYAFVQIIQGNHNAITISNSIFNNQAIIWAEVASVINLEKNTINELNGMRYVIYAIPIDTTVVNNVTCNGNTFTSNQNSNSSATVTPFFQLENCDNFTFSNNDISNYVPNSKQFVSLTFIHQ